VDALLKELSRAPGGALVVDRVRWARERAERTSRALRGVEGEI
jgi:hypothetical protein